ncbi:MAG: hypothetical protein HC905_21915 [Bacteroidales bacterium]|nr:hypothetical protein [Bacteroidales bacterium]
MDYRLKYYKKPISITTRFLVGMQPKDQDFYTSKGAFLGVLETKVDFRKESVFQPFVEFGVKTKGWVAGNELVGRAINFNCGTSFYF